MPGLNRKGPRGEGAMTGRKLGKCNPENKGKTDDEIMRDRVFSSGQEQGGSKGQGAGQGLGQRANQGIGQNNGFGFGRGRGLGLGMGLGLGRRRGRGQ